MKYIDPYQALANAIITVAADDYRILYEESRINPKSHSIRMKKYYLEKFFHSEYYKTLTDLDADYILKRIREEVDRKLKARYKHGR